MIQQEPHIIRDTQTKAQFMECVINHMVTDKIDDETISDTFTQTLHGYATGCSVITSNKLTSSNETMLNEM